MDIFDEKIDELLAKHLAGESSPEEETALAGWLQESPTHRKHLADLQWLWQHAAGAPASPPRTVDTEAALLRVKNRLHTGGGATRPLRWQRGFWVRAAAVFVLAAAVVYWWQSSQAPSPTYIAATQSTLTDTLADGSMVRLTPNSALTIAGQFNRRERRMQLQGEAFFQVAPDTLRPFVVEVHGLEVQVVGTAFTVDNATDSSTVRIDVLEGKVRVNSKSRSLLLLPGDQAVYDINTTTLTRSLVQQISSANPGRVFRFEATDLATVVRRLSEAYGTEITLKNKALEKCKLSTRFLNQPLDRVLAVIADSFSLRVEKVEKGYVLDGEGC